MKLKFGDWNKPHNDMSGILTTKPLWGDMTITKADGTKIVIPRHVIDTDKKTKEVMKAIYSSQNIQETANQYGFIIETVNA